MDANDFMQLGLKFAGYSLPSKCKIETNITRFKKHFGVHPLTCANLWVDMKTTPNKRACISNDAKPVSLLIGLRFMWKYESETLLGSFLA